MCMCYSGQLFGAEAVTTDNCWWPSWDSVDKTSTSSDCSCCWSWCSFIIITCVTVHVLHSASSSSYRYVYTTGTLYARWPADLRWTRTTEIWPVASRGLVSSGAVTDGVTLFVSWKTDDLLSRRFLESDDLFSCRLLTTPIFPRRLYSFLLNSATKKYFFRVSPPDGVTRGGPPLPPP